MSDLFRKEALDHRSRALFGEVVLRGPLGSWVLTILVIAVTALILAWLFIVDVQTADEPVRVIDFLLSGGRE
ncbi:hypothetical protein AB8615_00030 [Litorimonas sp. RW-G-Af-16]|uniref:hypothetical protein n=1 Tax=Litorimonas sp. RW-G-Af-16 TaxID=3241168 RepID=UPI003AAD3986